MTKHTQNTPILSKPFFMLFIGAVLGLLVGIGTLSFFNTDVREHSAGTTQQQSNDASLADEPLYWVAPMDQNFRRDKPGKSPMGMDLVPVYANELSSTDSGEDSPGTVRINPAVINNLGVKTLKIIKMLPEDEIRALGRIEYAQDALVHMHPRVEGWIESLNVSAKGEFIEKGEPLYSLYSPELVNAQEELLIALQRGNNNLINAAQSRLLSLNAPQTLIQSIKRNRKVQREVVFYAPQSGFITQLAVQEGFYVKPSTTMLAIASLDKVWVITDVFAHDLAKLRVGQGARITSDFLPGKSVSGKLDYIYPSVDQVSKTAKVRIVLDNTSMQLKPEMFVEVLLENAQLSQERLLVPRQAIIRLGQQNRVVLALGEGKFRSIEVDLGMQFDEHIEVIAGIEEGDEIVTSTQFLIDSESNISADFTRMAQVNTGSENETSGPHTKHKAHQQDMPLSAWTTASVNEVMLEERMVSLSHGPLDAFNMMGMTMNFMVADNIDMSVFSTAALNQSQIHVEIVKTDGAMYKVSTVHTEEKP